MTLLGKLRNPLRRRETVAADPAIATDPARLADWLVAWIARKAGIDAATIDRDQLFTDYGLNSLLAVHLSTALEELLGRPLSPSIAWEYGSVSELAAYLAAGGSGTEHDLDSAAGDTRQLATGMAD